MRRIDENDTQERERERERKAKNERVKWEREKAGMESD